MTAFLSFLAALALACGSVVVLVLVFAAFLAACDRLSRGFKRPGWVTCQQAKASRTALSV